MVFLTHRVTTDKLNTGGFMKTGRKEVERKENLLTTNAIVEEALDAWAEADAKGDLVVTKRRLEFFINFMSNLNFLRKHATSEGEIEEIQSAVEELKTAKEALRKINYNLAVAC